jgi:curved DNA-binding protein CbpA
VQQAVADAYYVLSDPQRRAEYDQIFRSRPASSFSTSTDPDEQDKASANFFEQFSQFFKEATGAGASAPSGSEPASGDSSGASTPPPGEPRRPDAEGVFGDVFADL